MRQYSAHVIIQFNKTSHFLKAIKHVYMQNDNNVNQTIRITWDKNFLMNV